MKTGNPKFRLCVRVDYRRAIEVARPGRSDGLEAGRRGDFSGDGKADLLWQDVKPGDANYGVVVVWVTGGAMQWLGQADPTVWKLAGVGDFSGDHKADVLWQDVKPGDANYGMVGAWVTGGAMLWLGQADPTVWALSGSTDFNGDGKADVLWQN